MKQLPMHKSIKPFGKDIFVLEMDETDTEKKIPLYADGFPGIVYSKSDNPFYQQPNGKKLSDFYLYGQTVEPITLEVNGAFKLICIRLYPFAVRILLDVDPKVLKDDCYDLRLVENLDTQNTLKKLEQTEDWGDIPPHWLVYFGANDCDAVASKVKELGGEVLVPPRDIPSTGRFAVLQDPQGAAFAIISMPNPD